MNCNRSKLIQICFIVVITSIAIATTLSKSYAIDCHNTYFVDPVQGNDYWNGRHKSFAKLASGPWKTLRKANRSLQAGDCVYLLEGVYSEPISPANSGTLEKGYIVYSAVPDENVVITKTAVLDHKKFIFLKDLHFKSDGASWITTNQHTAHIQLMHNRFDAALQIKAFGGITLYGHHYTLRNNMFGRWIGDMIYAIDVSHLLIENNDFSQSAADHATIQILGKNVIIRKNYFRNPWNRVLSITWKDDIATENILIENNLFIDSDWNRMDSHPRLEGSYRRGSGEVIHLNGNRAIFRNNLIIGNNKGKILPGTGILSFTAYDGRSPYYYGWLTNHLENIRVYHNTMYKNKNNAILFTSQSQYYPLYAENNYFINNIIYQEEDYLIKIVVHYIPWNTYIFESNLIVGQIKSKPILLTMTNEKRQIVRGDVPVVRAEQLFPQVFKNNIVQSPVFKDPAILTRADDSPNAFSLKDLDTFFASFSLTEDSPGLKAAKPLTTVTKSAMHTQLIEVKDALYFSDGMGMIEGDQILIGTNEAVRIKKILTATTFLIDAIISVNKGDNVYLKQTGRHPSIGIY